MVNSFSDLLSLTAIGVAECFWLLSLGRVDFESSGLLSIRSREREADFFDLDDELAAITR